MKHIARRKLLAVAGSHACVQGADRLDSKEDEDDTLPKEDVFSSKNAKMVVTSIITHITDICSSASVCYYLLVEGKLWWFMMMVVPLVVSLVVVNCFSMKWYWHDRKEQKSLIEGISKTHWALRIIFHVSFLGPVIRYLELYIYGIRSMNTEDPKREEYKVLVLQEERDISFLALVGSFMKSAPQLVLQVYILLQNKMMIHEETAHADEVSAAVSVINLSLALTSYHRALRRSDPTKLNMTTLGSGLRFASHFFIIGSRVIALAAFASVYQQWLFPFLFLHWYIMLMWLILKQTSFCTTKEGERRTCEEVLFNAVMAIIYTFCFMNVKDEPTRYKYTFYYALVWVENAVLTVLWYTQAANFFLLNVSVMAAVFIGLPVGLLVLAVYYKFFHPNKVGKITTFIERHVPMDLMGSSDIHDHVH